MHTAIDLEAIDPARTDHPSLLPAIGSGQPQSTPDELPQSSTIDTNYGDSSWPLYAMYSKIVQEEDNKIAKLHEKSADGILIFVSPRVSRLFLHTSIGKT
jgi:hypothetical protein